MTVPLTTSFGPYCPACNTTIALKVELEYFAKGEAACETCGASFDWFLVLVDLLENGTRFYEALAPTGAQTTVIALVLEPGKWHSLDLTEHGVPSDARLVFMSYQALGNPLETRVVPLEFHGESLDRRPKLKTTLVPIEVGAGLTTSQMVNVLAVAVWVPTLGASPWSEFIRALELHVAGDYEGAVVPASAATESATMRLTGAVLSKYSSRARVEAFQEEAGFSHIFNVVLPALAALLGFPQLPPAVRGQVNRLRKFRNEIAHAGKSADVMSKRASAECLAAALVSHRYAHLILASTTASSGGGSSTS